jgi:hypothetical protein
MQPPRLTLALRALCVAGALLATGCGGSDDAPPPTAPPAQPAVIAPAITTQPAAASVTEGASASFTVAASGTAPLTYQWRRGGSDIAGATASTYTVVATLADNGAAFSVVVRNAAGSATSNTAALTVTAQRTAPIITTQPAAASIAAGAGATFTVAVSGAPAPVVQWFIVGGGDLTDGAGSGTLAGATLAGTGTATLSLINVPVTANGLQLAARATNTAGTVTSAPAALTVNAAGQLVQAAAGGTVTSADGRVRLTLPPGALTADALVRIDPEPAFTVPAGLASELVGIAGSGYVIVTDGASLRTDRDLSLRINLAGLSGVMAVRPLGNPPVATPPADLLAIECPDGGDPVAVAFDPRNANSLDMGTVVRGCAAAQGGNNSRTRIAPTRLPPVPANVLWTLYRQGNDFITTFDFDHWQEAGGRSRTLMINEWSGTSVNLQLRLADEQGRLLADLPLPAETTLARIASSGVLYTARPITVRETTGPCSGTVIGRSTEVVVWRMSLRLPGWRIERAASVQIPGTPGTAALVSGNCLVTGAVNNAPSAMAVDPVTGALVLLGQGDSANPGFPELAPSAGAAPGFLLRVAPDASVSQVQRVHATVGPIATDRNGNVLVGGSGEFLARLPAAYGANLGTCPFAAPSCVVLAKFSPAGALRWARYVDGHFIGSTRAELGADRSGNAIYVSGSGSGSSALVSTVDGASGQPGTPVGTGVANATIFTTPRVDSQNRVVLGVRSSTGAFVVTPGTNQVTPVPSANPLQRFDFALDASDRVVSAHGSSIVASTLCTPFPSTPGFCRGWLMQKFTR